MADGNLWLDDQTDSTGMLTVMMGCTRGWEVVFFA